MTTQEMNTEDALRAILDNLEMEQSMKNQNETISYVNQPEKIAISSNNGEQAQITYNGYFQNAFYNFTVNLPRPALGVKSLELLSVNIPQCQVNLPDDSLVFYYYRVKTQRNVDDTETILNDPPSSTNLYYVRLLPSYYKKELIPNGNNYGINRTFTSYSDLATELVKACSTDLAYVNANNSSSHFIPNDISIVFNDTLNRFQMVGNNTNTSWVPTTWTAGTYKQYDIVRYISVNYISTTNNNTSTPGLTPTVTAWVTSPQVYLPKDIVSYLGNNYTCIYENNGITPIGSGGSSTYWILTAWNSSTDYAALRGPPYNLNWPVTYGGIYYFNLNVNSNLNKQPNLNPSFWTTNNWEVYTGPLKYAYLVAGYEDPNVWTLTQSLKTVFDGLDFNMNTFVTPATAQLYSIPSAPIQQYQTLNLRLGFTFNGLYNWSVNTIIAGNADIFSNGNIYALLFNRLRPVPPYEIEFGLGAPRLSVAAIPSTGNPYTATTFTADAFANLVYSSIINIYTNIIGPSTTDTERNINLLDTVPLNCNNLGITFYNPVISNKLTKIPPDVYSIYFEFRREDGTEYYFSNNAIITLTLGLTYK